MTARVITISESGTLTITEFDFPENVEHLQGWWHEALWCSLFDIPWSYFGRCEPGEVEADLWLSDCLGLGRTPEDYQIRTVLWTLSFPDDPADDFEVQVEWRKPLGLLPPSC